MGGSGDEPRPGFNKWVSFKGQGTYYHPVLNIDGKVVRYSDTSYTTEVLTDLSLEWLKNRKKEKPFFLYLSHNAVHSIIKPANPVSIKPFHSLRVSFLFMIILLFNVK